MRKSRFKLRVAHIDIGRQMETVGFLKRFISFSADNGFNTVQLYLEGRIRTKSFPLHPVEESCGAFPSVGLDQSDDDVGAPGGASATLVEHGEGLADTGGGSQVDPQHSPRCRLVVHPFSLPDPTPG